MVKPTRKEYDKCIVKPYVFTKDYTVKDAVLYLEGEVYEPYNFSYQRMIDMINEGVLILKTMEYPEHNKLKAIAEQSQAIGTFLEWLNNTKGLSLVEFNYNGSIESSDPDPTDLLAEYFGIDTHKLEVEKREMLKQFKNDAFHKKLI